MAEQKIYNKEGEEIRLQPIEKFLSEYPDQRQSLAALIEKGAPADDVISPSKLQRKCLIGYNKALAMLNVLIDSNIAIDTSEPREKMIFVDEEAVEVLLEFVLTYVTDAE